MKFLSDLITDIVVLFGFAAIIDNLWVMKEIELYGQAQPSTVDSYICIVLAVTLTILLHLWRNSRK